MNEKRAQVSSDQFMPQLDGLRALAVGAVLVHHLVDSRRLPGIIAALPLGFGGVRLFFVLSGFLITGILIRARVEAESNGTGLRWVLRQFYARRFLRIFPLYYLVIGVGLVVNLEPVREEFWWLASYLYNYRLAALGWYHANIAHFWSLAVEEQFYLAWPFIALFAPIRALKRIAVVMILIGPATRLLCVVLGTYGPAPYVITPSCLDALGCGALLAVYTGGGSASAALTATLTRKVLPLGLLSMAILDVLHRQSATSIVRSAHIVMYDAAMALVFVWLVAASSRGFAGPLGKLLTFAPVSYCGRIAYGIYVYHLVIATYVFDLGIRWGLGWQRGTGAVFFTTAVLTIALASASWYLFERPLNDLKRYFPYRASTGAGTSTPVIAI